MRRRGHAPLSLNRLLPVHTMAPVARRCRLNLFVDLAFSSAAEARHLRIATSIYRENSGLLLWDEHLYTSPVVLRRHPPPLPAMISRGNERTRNAAGVADICVADICVHNGLLIEYKHTQSVSRANN